MDEIDETLFEKMVVDDGRHKKLFLSWKAGEISEEEFESRETQIMEQLVCKFRCSVCQRKQSQH